MASQNVSLDWKCIIHEKKREGRGKESSGIFSLQNLQKVGDYQK